MLQMEINNENIKYIYAIILVLSFAFVVVSFDIYNSINEAKDSKDYKITIEDVNHLADNISKNKNITLDYERGFYEDGKRVITKRGVIGDGN